MTTTNRFPVVVVVVAFLVALGIGALLPRFGLFGRRAATGGRDASLALLLPSFDRLGPWLQHPITADSLHGHIVVVVLWSDTSPRAMRALPDVEAWHRAYARYGVRVIGVHLPEFAFAADTAVAMRFVKRLGLTFPIVSDPSYRVWGRLSRTVDRPAFYLADTSGHVVFETGGEQTAVVDRVLRQTIASLHPGAGVPTDGTLAPIATPPVAPGAIHLGTALVESGPLKGADPGRAQTFTAQFRFQEGGRANVGYPVGRWIPNAEGIIAAHGGPGDYVALRTEGTVWAVLAPPSAPAETPARVWVLAGDDWLSPEMAGADVQFDARGASYLDVAEPRLYAIARCESECVLKLSPDLAGTEFYSFLHEPLR